MTASFTAHESARRELADGQAAHLAFLSILTLKFRYLLVRPDAVWAEDTTILSGLLPGLWLLLPFQTFGLGPGTQSLLNTASERQWGMLLVGCALASLYGLLREHARWRLFATLGMSVLWTSITWLFWLGNPTGFAVALCPIFAVNALYAYLRLGMLYGWPWPTWTSRQGR